MSFETESLYNVIEGLCCELKILNEKLDRLEDIEKQRNEILANAFVWGWGGENRLDKQERKDRFPELTKNPNYEVARNDNKT